MSVVERCTLQNCSVLFVQTSVPERQMTLRFFFVIGVRKLSESGSILGWEHRQET